MGYTPALDTMTLLRPALIVILATAAAPAAHAGAAARPPVASWRDAAARIDRHAEAGWKEARLTAAPDAGDAEFLRRVTLDLVGRIPTPGEVTAFLADRNPGKREAVVDRLLASDDYAEHWGTIYVDLLVGREVRLRKPVLATADDWFVAAFRGGMPMDTMARELITARGDLRDNGAVSLLVGNKMRGGSLESLAGDVAREFIGQQIQCAQCHDHPSDKRFKQEDFAAFAAWFAEVRLVPVKVPGQKGHVSHEVRDVALGMQARPNANMPLRRVAPRYFGAELTPQPGETRRQTLARALIASPLFARAAVNRTWTRLFGRGTTDPRDDLGAVDDPRQPVLLRDLADDLIRAGYDHRFLLRAIVLSRTYGRSSSGGSAPTGAAPGLLEARFARAAVRPLTADQLFRSQLLATGVEGAAGVALPRFKLEKRKQKAMREYLFTFEDDEGGESDAFQGSVPQALLMRNGELTNEGVRALAGVVLGRILAASPDPAQRLEWLFIAAYARPPTDAEKQRYVAYLGKHAGEAAYEDLFHALLTSTEFLTNH